MQAITHKPVFWIAFTVLSALCGALAWRYFPDALPLINLDVKMSRAAALEQGAALKAIDLTALAYRLQILLQHPHLLAQLRQRSHALGRPHAGRAVLEIVLKHLATLPGQPFNPSYFQTH